MSATASQAPVWLNPAEAAVKAKRSENTILRWIRDGLLPCSRDKLTRRISVRASDLDAVLGAGAVAPAPAGS